MKRINLLDEHTSNKIAAGEVVERPSSVVKELVENSIDAASKNITIEIEEGGISLIRVIDDGVGVHNLDIEKAFLPHATSKIKTVEDIYSINTLGFRGEALPSIASVSKLLFRSKPSECDFGKEIILEAGEKLSLTDIGMNNGSVMEVKELFFNVPARRKFLKSTSREGSLINDIILRIALSNPDISFKLFNNGKKTLHTYGDGKLNNVIRTIYGKNISDNVLPFDYEDETLKVHGYIGKETIARGSRNNESIFVNNRYIKNKTIVAAVENAFKSFSTVNKFPFFVLFIDLSPDSIDVNIHPTKAEIKFKDERVIYKRVFDAVHTALKEDIFNSFAVEDKFVNEEIVEEIKLDLDTASKSNNIDEPITSNKVEPSIKDIYNNVTIQDIAKEEDLYNKLKELNKNKAINSYNNNYETLNNTTVNENINNSDYYTKNDFASSQANVSNVEQTNKFNSSTTSIEITTEKEVNKAKFPDLRVIGQFSKTYILAEYLDTLYIIDQHAAHEKILYEKYLKDIESNEIIVQQLLIPCIIDLSLDDYECYKENIEVFTNSGFVIEEFGGNTIALKEVPYFLGKLDSKNFLLSIIDNLKNLGSGKTVEVKLNKIATMACKAAVKANDYLTQIEMEKLISDLRYIDNPFNCPHGRPIIIKFTEYELDKKFRRIV
ncbi:DNA mismatch repair endonuclease MutL [uncultured Clostridium sp.]|uniref:DNA mismatch repair endonuclease MutL n=1 Tax=uncultured Clostridium sp. TaxID=59620 RepID=UPI0025DF75BF|nr:DNA mismatch repair endonuclease MutL [uncultured Clostridium sp.]MDU4882251.1 DNA mismatch repair endonuclease MutL [Clostridium celatum]MDU7075521.1 DNA mismatch repair endonuclease MutL [Clostridium celatum]